MCRLSLSPSSDNAPSVLQTSDVPYFECSRLNSTTFLVVEHDKWNENPFIYVKVYPHNLVVIDTGCGGATHNTTVRMTLRKFLETQPLFENGNEPLNLNGQKPYIIILSHCHYDHIGGLAEFTNTPSPNTVWASAHGKDLMYASDHFPRTSLCSFVGMKTPICLVTHWAQDGESVVDCQGRDLGLVIYQTPGHTPDELAVWDASERFLFVGDTAYETAPILFPVEGNVVEYATTLAKLKGLVNLWNMNSSTENTIASVVNRNLEVMPSRVQMACGHIVSSIDAEDFIGQIDSFLLEIKQGKAIPQENGDVSWEPTWLDGMAIEQYTKEGGQISFLGPKASFDQLKQQ